MTSSMQHLKPLFFLPLLLLMGLSTTSAEPPEFAASKSTAKVKVFILAGQSNMEGRGFPEPLTWQVSQEKYRERYTHFIKDGDYARFVKTVEDTRDPDDRRKTPTYLWSERKDVWINYLGKHGNLKVGYGAPNEGFGPEFNFGHVLGNHYDEQVLIIKTSWGGRALAQGFLPPSSMPTDAEFEVLTQAENNKNIEWNMQQKIRVEKNNLKIAEENKTAEKKKALQKYKPRPVVSVTEYKQRYGIDYRNMVHEVHDCLANLKERFPGYQGQGYEIEGFVWFQGWNDQYNDRWLSYEKNLGNLIRDLRKEFDVPGMKIVIGEMGHDGPDEPKPDAPRTLIMSAQQAVAKSAEFKKTSTCVNTRQYWDMEAHNIYHGPGGWSKDVDKWRQFGNDRPYHYLGSPWFFAQAGTGFGEAMVKLLGKDK